MAARSALAGVSLSFGIASLADEKPPAHFTSRSYPPEFAVRMDGKSDCELVMESGSGGVRWNHVFLEVKTPDPLPVSGSFVIHRDGHLSAIRFRLPTNANIAHGKGNKCFD